MCFNNNMMMSLKKQKKVDKEIFKNIFDVHWDDFKSAYPRFDRDQYEEPVQKMLGCGNELGGYSERICLHCGQDIRRVPFSCKSCFCLSCSKKYVDDFVSQISCTLHPGVIYRHIVLTIQEQLRLKFFHERHSGDLLSEFMKCGYECLEDVVSKAIRKELKIGCIVVVQTHGRSGRYNPHLHIIMTSGGINTDTEIWSNLGYFKYELMHKKWQYHLLTFIRTFFGNEVNQLVDELWKKYPKGFVANVSKGEVPDQCKGLAAYLAKYVASPPIAVRRIVSYDGQTVKYWYKDHKTKSKKIEVVDVLTFIGRMVQRIMPKCFQRVRYYGLQATKTFKK
ncbi:transposase, partial [Desulfobacterales bacterium HSG17]|nr:transposase [Desulfobacterales bacterium HSG17]